MADEELRAAVRAFLRSWATPRWLLEKGEKEFENIFEQIFEQGVLADAFREFHAEHGRYPEYEEICPPGGPTICIVPDI